VPSSTVTFGHPAPQLSAATPPPREDRHLVVEFASPAAMAHAKAVLDQQTHAGRPGELWAAVDAFVPSDLASGALVQVRTSHTHATLLQRARALTGCTCLQHRSTPFPPRGGSRMHVLSQVALDPQLASVFAELQGAAVDLELLPGAARDLATAGAAPSQVTFAELQAAVQARAPGCVLVGLKRPTNLPGERTLLCPSGAFAARPSDRLLVLRFPAEAKESTPREKDTACLMRP
jgi:hypothetical protein